MTQFMRPNLMTKIVESFFRPMLSYSTLGATKSKAQ